MPFVDIPTLNDGQIHVSATSVYRVTRSIHGAGGNSLTRVEFGTDYQLTQMACSAVADLLRGAGANLIELIAPDTTHLFLSVPAITAIKDADPHIDPPGAQAVITVAGHRQSVQQTRQQVQQILAAAG